jgi:hypothetical protein
MGLTAKNLKYILRVRKKYGIKGPILTFGNQDIYSTKEDVMKWIEEIGLPLKVPSTIYYSTSKEVIKINKEALNYIHAKTFFEFLDIPQDQYYDIDKFPFDKPVILHDLEKPFDAHYHNFFNFVVDSGTMEHIFDVKSVMNNIVQITKVGGYVLQLIPAQNFLNHGFYQFSPTFFYDFYTSNGFEIVESYVIEMQGNVDRFHKYDQEKDYFGLFFNPNNWLVNCFLVHKTTQVKEIVSPDQYIYKKIVEDPIKTDKDFNKTRLDKIVSSCRKIIPIKFHGVFFKYWIFLKCITCRRDFFDIKS